MNLFWDIIDFAEFDAIVLSCEEAVPILCRRHDRWYESVRQWESGKLLRWCFVKCETVGDWQVVLVVVVWKEWDSRSFVSFLVVGLEFKWIGSCLNYVHKIFVLIEARYSTILRDFHKSQMILWNSPFIVARFRLLKAFSCPSSGWEFLHIVGRTS